MITQRFFPLFILTVLAIGCGRSATPAEIPIGPEDDAALSGTAQYAESGNRYIWGLWRISISADRNTIDIVPDRTGAMHLNAVRLLEETACTKCLEIHKSFTPGLPGEPHYEFDLKHPLPDHDEFTGFDVRGIFITGADYTFPVSGRRIAWGDDFPRIVLPDGYTTLFNPSEFPPSGQPVLSYIPGKYAVGGDLSATLNPFLAFERDKPRRVFDTENTYIRRRTVHLRLPDGPIEFGYAVDVCWQEPYGEVTDPITDFPPDANCLEAYKIVAQLSDVLQADPGSIAHIYVLAYDHQGKNTIDSVTVEAPDLFIGELELSYSMSCGDKCCMFAGEITNELGAGYGQYPVMVRVVDTESDQNLGTVDAWQVCQVRVGKKGWAHTWGAANHDEAMALACDSNGNIYVTGMFSDAVDLDPGPPIEEHDSGYGSDTFLSKFDASGNLQWVRTWGGEYEYDFGGSVGWSVAVDLLGDVYVAGWFKGNVDFDPGSGTDYRGSVSNKDYFLSKFDSSGQYLWVQVWVGPGSTGTSHWPCGVAADDSGAAFVTGAFKGTVDFHPGSGSAIRTAVGGLDVFLSKFSSSGEFMWVRTWGSDEGNDPQVMREVAHDVAVDASGNPYVTGKFYNTIDFDPGSEIDEHTSTGGANVFLSKFDGDGDFQWARTWGGNRGYAVAVSVSGFVFVTGIFYGTVDFDPGSAIDEHVSNHYRDVFLSKFDSDGGFHWARTWGGYEDDQSRAVTTDASSHVFVTGYFHDIVDFDPGPGIDEHSSYCDDHGQQDVFLSKFDDDGSFVWARTWGGPSADCGYGTAADSSGNAYVTGYFYKTVDFDPGPGTDHHCSNGYHDVFLTMFPPDGNW